MAKTRNKKNVASEKRPIVCPPDKAGRDLRTRILGYAARIAVLTLAVFGLAFFVTDAFRFHYKEIIPTYIDDPIVIEHAVTDTVFLAALLAVLILSAIGLFRRVRICALPLLGLGAGATALLAVLIPRFGRTLYAVGATLLNCALDRLHRAKFFTLVENLEVPDVGLSDETLVRLAAALLTVLFAVVFVPCLLRRTWILPPALLSAAILVFIFSCNIARSNWAFVLVLSTFSALIVMGAYDGIYLRRLRRTEKTENNLLFPDDADRPTLPSEVLEAKARRNERRLEKKRARKERRIARKEKKKHVVTVDEELSDYYFAEDKRAAKRSNRGAVRLTPEERSAEKKRARLEKQVAAKEKREKRREIQRGVRAVRDYDRVTSDSRAAMGGFAGLAVFLILFLMLLAPAATVKGRFTTIPAIDDKLAFCREYLTALLVGDEDILDQLNYEQDQSNFTPHDATLTNRYYEGKELFYVRSRTSANIYLRGWIATDFKDDAWHAVSKDQLTDYRELYTLEDAPGEEIKARFYDRVLRSAVPELFEEGVDLRKTNMGYLSNYGTVLEEVNVNRLEGGLGTAVFMPVSYLPEFGLTNFESTKKSGMNFINYYDGILTGRDFAKKDSGYSVVAHVSTMKDPNFIYRISKGIAEYNMNMKLCSLFENGFFTSSYVNPNLIVVRDGSESRYTATYDPYNVRVILKLNWQNNIVDIGVYKTGGEYDFSLFTSYVMTMTKSEKKATLEEYEYYNTYRDFVYDTYLTTMTETEADGTVRGSEILKSLSAELAEKVDGDFLRDQSSDPATYEARYAYVMEVINYMKENCTYIPFDEETYDVIVDTESLPSDPSLNSVENFLTVTKEGICVQFASALTLLLREQGIPARYVEGYLVNDQTRDRNYRDVYYHGTVRDYNFHAWVEVWFDGIGWMQYEATTGEFYNDMYSSVEDALPDSDDPYEEEEDDPYEEEEDFTDDEKEETPDPDLEAAKRREAILKAVKTALTVLAVLAAVTAIVLTVVLLARRKERERDRLIDTAREGAYEDGERRTLALRLIDEITALLLLYGLVPLPGELRAAYADRLVSAMPEVFSAPEDREGDDGAAPTVLTEPLDAHACMMAIAREEFGDGMTREDVKLVSELFLRVRTQKKRFVSLPKRFVLHYFAHKL